ncbi:uncharacterized protein LOC128217149 [Mya arenaria]|uniref:uncharacterized protein LOC128217149 n=1 Tax=Mya arenaria TaxID=6604 RepID=UPI0022E02DF1|nr:uncharacterized protein LOC128217149 [Mya arenaria]
MMKHLENFVKTSFIRKHTLLCLQILSNSGAGWPVIPGPTWVLGVACAVVLLVPAIILAAVTIKRRRQVISTYKQFGRSRDRRIPSDSSMPDACVDAENHLCMDFNNVSLEISGLKAVNDILDNDALNGTSN